MSYEIVKSGQSKSFPADHDFTRGAVEGGKGLCYLGTDAGQAYAKGTKHHTRVFVAIELDTECLGLHTGEESGLEGSNVVGFARYRLGKGEPTSLVELVKQPNTSSEALDAAKMAFEAANLNVAICNDFPGRIIDRLIRPYFNAALRRLDEKLASAADLDKTLCLGLGYPEGPIALLERTGLADHCRVTRALFESLGQEAYSPARRAVIAAERARNS